MLSTGQWTRVAHIPYLGGPYVGAGPSSAQN
jgi:hypothetical protein